MALVFGALGVLGVAGQPRAETPDDPGAFLGDLTDRAIAQLTDTSVPVAQRKMRFRTLFRASFDIPSIGRFVVGRYWRRTDDSVRREFLTAFEDIMVERFAPQFTGYGETRFKIDGVRALKRPDQYIVSSTITPPGTETIQVDWRVRRVADGFRVLDVVGQGVSMAITLRAEYAAVLKNAGGRVEDLIELLRERTVAHSELATTGGTN
ncbi:MAG: phospholipid-binding protein MlaC [Kiloniellaceae bacterium]